MPDKRNVAWIARFIERRQALVFRADLVQFDPPCRSDRRRVEQSLASQRSESFRKNVRKVCLVNPGSDGFRQKSAHGLPKNKSALAPPVQLVSWECHGELNYSSIVQRMPLFNLEPRKCPISRFVAVRTPATCKCGVHL